MTSGCGVGEPRRGLGSACNACSGHHRSAGEHPPDFAARRRLPVRPPLLPPRDHLIILQLIVFGVELAGLALIPVILLQRKEPTSTFAWILTLLFLPFIGAVLFLLFGRVTIRQNPAPAPLSPGRGRDPALPAPADTSDLSATSFRIAQVVTNTLATRGNAITVLEDGDDTYRAMGIAIDQATTEINAEYYLIHDDAVGCWFRERLVAAAGRGVKVRLLYDGIGSLGIGRHWTRPLRILGGEAVSFSPLRRALVTSPNLRNHRKIVVVDRRIAFTGGINICIEHSTQYSGANAWRDVHLQIEGPAVNDLLRIFATDWAWVTHSYLKPMAEATVQNGSAARLAVIPAGPDSHGQTIHRLFFATITAARRKVSLISPYFGPDDTLLIALETVAMRGVDVELILPAKSNHRVTFHAGRSLYERLLEAGVGIFEYQPGMIHSKLLFIDDELALVGSSNMDLRSFRLNFEVTTLIEEPATVQRLLSIFAECLAHCARIDLADWRRRGLRLTLKEGMSRLLSPLL